jgi:nitroreductase
MQMVDGDRMMTDAFPEFFDLVGNVRAIRRLKTDPVPLELIHKVLNAGVQAPSGQNTQPWAFVLVSDPERKRWFADHYAAAMESRFGLPIDPGSRKDMRIGRQLRALF